MKDFRYKLASILIEAGISGIKQGVLTHKMLKHATASELTEQLEEWLELGYVQRFVYFNKTNKVTHWRATEAIKDVEV